MQTQITSAEISLIFEATVASCVELPEGMLKSLVATILSRSSGLAYVPTTTRVSNSIMLTSSIHLIRK